MPERVAVLLNPVFISQNIDAIRWSLESHNVMQFTIAETLQYPAGKMRNMTGLMSIGMLTAGHRKVNSQGREAALHRQFGWGIIPVNEYRTGSVLAGQFPA